MELSPDIKFKDYLKSELDRRMTLNTAYSMRAFARDLKLPVSRLSELLSGKAGVSLSRVEEIVGCLRLSDNEAQFVKDIASIEFGKSILLKNQAIKRISSLRKTSYQMTAEDFEEISDWYYFAILELISKVETENNLKALSYKIGIKLSLCEFAVKRLIRKGFLIEDSGFWKTTNKSMSVPGEPRESIQKFHKQFAAESVKAFTNSDFIEREFISTFAMLTEEEIQVLRLKMNALVDDAFTEITEQRKHQKNKKMQFKLYGLGLQLFPVKAIKSNLLNTKENVNKEII
jgi:uncharacterized protein (TIGR02147 family)